MSSLIEYLRDYEFEQVPDVIVAPQKDGSMHLYRPTCDKNNPQLFSCSGEHKLPLVIMRFRYKRKRRSHGKGRYRQQIIICGLLVLTNGTFWYRRGNFTEEMCEELEREWDIATVFHERGDEEQPDPQLGLNS